MGRRPTVRNVSRAAKFMSGRNTSSKPFSVLLLLGSYERRLCGVCRETDTREKVFALDT